MKREREKKKGKRKRRRREKNEKNEENEGNEGRAAEKKAKKKRDRESGRERCAHVRVCGSQGPKLLLRQFLFIGGYILRLFSLPLYSTQVPSGSCLPAGTGG